VLALKERVSGGVFAPDGRVREAVRWGEWVWVRAGGPLVVVDGAGLLDVRCVV
jgi:hypothetical protein